MSRPIPNNQTKSVGKPHFHVLPEICHRRGYELLRLGQNSAKCRAGNYLFEMHKCTIYAEGAFRFEQGLPDRVRQFVADRNQELSQFAWLNYQGLHLIQPIEGSVVTTPYLEASISAMLSEIHAFSRKLRENGIWK